MFIMKKNNINRILLKLSSLLFLFVIFISCTHDPYGVDDETFRYGSIPAPYQENADIEKILTNDIQENQTIINKE